MTEDDKDEDKPAVEDERKVERALEGLGRLLPRRVKRITVDQHMANDYLRGDVDEVRRRGKSQG